MITSWSRATIAVRPAVRPPIFRKRRAIYTSSKMAVSTLVGLIASVIMGPKLDIQMIWPLHQDGPLGVGGVELADHVDGLAVAHNAGLGVAFKEILYGIYFPFATDSRQKYYRAFKQIMV